MPNQNAPARKGEGVVCLLAGDTDAFTTARLRLQHLNLVPAMPGPIILRHLGLPIISWERAA